MTVLIDNKSSLPIYDQIYSQIKAQIISGELQEHSRSSSTFLGATKQPLAAMV